MIDVDVVKHSAMFRPGTVWGTALCVVFEPYAYHHQPKYYSNPTLFTPIILTQPTVTGVSGYDPQARSDRVTQTE